MLGRNKGNSGERTAADRAAAAAERARRRGEAPPPSFDAEEPQAPPAEPAAPPPEQESYEPAPFEIPATPAQPDPEPDWHTPAAEDPYAAPPVAEPEPYAPPPAAAQPDPEPYAPPPAEPAVDPAPYAAEPDPEPAWHEPATGEHDREAVSWFESEPDTQTQTRHWDDPVQEPEPYQEPEPEPDPVPAPVPHIPRSGRRAAPPVSPRAGGQRAAPARPTAKGGRGGKPPKAPRRPVPSGARPPSRIGRRVAALVVLLVIAAGAWAAVATFQPFHGEPRGIVRVQIPTGADAGEIGDLLEQQGVIDSGRFFSVNATVTGRRGSLVAGKYSLQRDMSYGAVLDALGKGPKAAPKPKTYKLTVAEGLSIDEAAKRIGNDVEGSYAKAADSAATLKRARKLGLPRKAKTAEGYLFPATFDLVRGAPASDLVAKQLDAFATNTSEVSYRRAKSRGLSRYEVLIIASMVERETSLDKERPLVASVIYNRLKQGMPLGIDATIRYAENNWTKPLKVSELEREGPYNTRLNRGLPPTPIGNPGAKSIEAAARPASSSFLYYVVKPGTQGHAFSSTEAQFSRDVERYNAAREANGGNAP